MKGIRFIITFHLHNNLQPISTGVNEETHPSKANDALGASYSKTCVQLRAMTASGNVSTALLPHRPDRSGKHCRTVNLSFLVHSHHYRLSIQTLLEFQPVSSDGFHSRNFWAPSHLFHQCLFSHLQHLETDLGCRRTWAAEEPIFLLSLANSAFQDVALPLIYGLTGIVLVHSPALVKCSGENFLETCSS